MKRTFLLLCTMMLLGVTSAWSSDVRVGAGIHIQLGDPAPAPYVVSQPPLFLYPEDLGFYVAVGVPFGLFYIDDYYYTIRRGVWSFLPTTTALGTMSRPVIFPRDWSGTGTVTSFIGVTPNTSIT